MEETIREMKRRHIYEGKKWVEETGRKRKINENETEGDRKERGIMYDAVGPRDDNGPSVWLPVSKGLITPVTNHLFLVLNITHFPRRNVSLSSFNALPLVDNINTCLRERYVF
jgi:hypothetical protein